MSPAHHLVYPNDRSIRRRLPEPFATGVWQLTGDVLDTAERINEAALERYKKCLYTSVWPTGYEEIRLIDSL